MSKLNIGIILSTVRKQRVGNQIAEWVKNEAQKISDDNFEIVDLIDYHMAFYGTVEVDNEAERFKDKLKQLDGYIFVVAEYNHSIPGVLKNAFDYVNDGSMSNKAAGIISYGAVGGARSAEHLRHILSQLNVAHISRQVLFSIFEDFENFKKFKPLELHMSAFKELVENTTKWSKALKTIK